METDEKRFFDLIDRYLISDLETMVNKIPAWESGGLGYSAIHSIISGMELLGKVLSGRRDRNAFYYIWDNYLVNVDNKYKNLHLKKVFYSSIRQGTAHYFLIKSKISLTKQGDYHLEEIRGHLNIDLKILYDDFHKVYKAIKKDVLVNKDRITLQNFREYFPKLLTELKSSEIEVESYLKELPSAKSTSKKITTQSGIQTIVEPPSLSSNVSVTLPPEEWLKNKQRK